MSRNTLQSCWQRHDWQTSPFAPDLKIVQALVGGKTASGAGMSRYDALSRCMGETAEIIALKEGESSEGLAAGPDFTFAAAHALHERLERWALWEWWQGRLSAAPLNAEALVTALRHRAAEKRETSLWFLPDFPHIHVVIAKSCSTAGTQPILGFGANICPQKAADSALIELGLMELNLHPPAPGLPAFAARLASNANALLPTDALQLPPQPKRRTAGDSLTAANIRFTLQDRSPIGLNIAVVKAEIQSAPSWNGTLGPLL